MADAALTVKSYLIQDATLMAMLGTLGVKSGELSEKFNPAFKPVITVALHTGKVHSEVSAIAFEVMRVRVWAGKNQYQLAWNVYAQVQRLLAGTNMINVAPYGFITSSTEASHTPITEPESGWATILGIF